MSDLAPKELSQTISQLRSRFAVSDELLLLVSVPEGSAHDASCLLDFAGRLATPSDILEVVYEIGDLEALLRSEEFLEIAPLFTPEGSAGELDAVLTPAGIRETLRKQSLLIELPEASEAIEWLEIDPLELRRFAIARWSAGTAGMKFQKGSRAFLSEDGRSLLIRVRATGLRGVSSSIARDLLAVVDRMLETAHEEHSSSCPHGAKERVRVEKTGGTPLAEESERFMRRDLQINIGLSVVFILIVLFAAWRRGSLVLLAAVPVGCGILIGFGLYSLISREIVVLALVSGAVLAALGIDFVIHLLQPLRDESGAVTESRMVDVVGEVQRSLVLAASSTIVGFLSFVFVSSGFLRDMGVLTACGIAACLVSAIFVLPAVVSLSLSKPRKRDPERPPRMPRAPLSSRLGNVSLRQRRVVLVGAVVVSIVSAVSLYLSPPEIATDLRKVHARGSEALATQDRLGEVFGAFDDPVLLLVREESSVEKLSDGLARLDRELEKLRTSGAITGWSSVSRLVPSPGEQKAVLSRTRAIDGESLLHSFEQALEEEGFAAEEFRPAIERFGRFLERREPIGLEEVVSLGLRDEILQQLSIRADGVMALVSVRVGETLWEADRRDALFARLDDAARTANVECEISGLHASSSNSARFVVGHFIQAVSLALGSVVLLVIVLFRRLRLIVAALAPVVLGSLWTAAIWNACGFQIHFMNVGILPMILGIGVDDGIHLVARFTQAGEPTSSPRDRATEVLRTTAPAVVLTTLTTLAAFGTLATSTTRGLASVGMLSALGVSLCLFASLTVLPALLASGRGYSESS